MAAESIQPVAGSFRDPSGFVFKAQGQIYRQINQVYAAHYTMLRENGLYDKLVSSHLLIPHEEVDVVPARPELAWKVIKPQQIPLISYPYEWSFSQLKAAALATLRIQKRALQHGMSLKDASAYNIQFIDGQPVLIDTLSFEPYVEGLPWVAYKQFCQHFLAPLALMYYRDIRLGQMLRLHIDGIPLDIASTLLPARTYLSPGLMMHLHLHARAQRRYADSEPTPTTTTARRLDKKALLNILTHLTGIIELLNWKVSGTAWAEYYQWDNSYIDTGLDHKKMLVTEFLQASAPRVVWDLGANTGMYSRIAAEMGCFTVAWDIDPGAVELNFQDIQKHKRKNILPLIVDLTNPSPALGWANRERDAFAERSNADILLALALIHHLAIVNNVPLAQVAAFLVSLAEWLIIEFVPKSDPKVKKLLATRQDIFADYTPEGFEAAFQTCYDIVRVETIQQSDRRLYLMKRRGPGAG